MILDQWTLAAAGHLELKWIDEAGLGSRGTRRPGADVTDLPAEVQAACTALWTAGYVDDWLAEHDPPPGPPTLVDLVSYADGRRDSLLEAGLDYGGLHIHLGTAARADLTGMGATAIGVIAGAMAWPAEYALGWISIENVRIPMPIAADGLALAGAAGTHYAAIAQRNRDVKDAAIAGIVTTFAEIDAAFADVTAPWSPAP